MSHSIVEGKKNRFCSKCGKEEFSDLCRHTDNIEQDKVKIEQDKVNIEQDKVNIEQDKLKLEQDKLKLKDKEINYNLIGCEYIF
jgi:hypothetical protein